MSTLIVALEGYPYSNRHGIYGGAAGDKDGISINGGYWIVKYPKPEREFESPIDMSYNTSPLSEYIGSHVYQALGIPVHETMLGIRHNKIVVACRDFCDYRGQLTEMRTIKNGANNELESILNHEMHYSTSGDRVNLNELLLHLDHNPILHGSQEVKNRFWDTVVVDILIDNNDRNNGNWGLLYDEKTNSYSLAPVYDNGNSFANKTNDDKLQLVLNSDDKKRIDTYTGSRTAYDYNGHILSAKKMIKLDIPELKNAIERLTPVIYNKMPEIYKMIDDLPERFGDKLVCSDIRKTYYKESLDTRFEKIICPEYIKIKGIEMENLADYLENEISKFNSFVVNDDFQQSEVVEDYDELDIDKDVININDDDSTEDEEIDL